MNQQDRMHPFILFLDGHASRMSPFALRLFNMHNIIVIVLPAHASHVLQPFDVSVAAAIKSYYVKNLINNLQYYVMPGLSDAMKARYARIRAFKDAWSSISPTDCQKAFKSAGIFPFDENAIAMEHLIHPAANEIYAGRTSALSCNNISSNEFIERMPAYTRRIRVDDGSVYDLMPPINYTEARIVWNTAIYEVGHMWSKFPEFPVF